MNSKIFSVVWLVGVLAPLTACGSPAADGRSPAPGPYELTSGERDLVRHAEQILIGQCMGRRGFSYLAMPPPAPSTEAPSFPYAIADTTWAEAHGLGAEGHDASRAAVDDPNQRYLSSLPRQQQERFTAALTGTASSDLVGVTLPSGMRVQARTDSCLAQAQGALYGDFRRWFRARVVVDNLPSEIQPKVLSDPRYEQALHVWSECMSRLGHAYRSPTELRGAFSQLAGRLEPAKSRVLELQLASAEATCAQQTGLVATATDLEHQYGKQVYAVRRNQIQAHRTMQTAALDHARSLVLPTESSSQSAEPS